MITRVPQNVILDSLFFYIFLNNIFLFILKCQLRNSVDDNTLCKSGRNVRKIKNNLVIDFMILDKWIQKNHMVINPGKCHYIGIGDDDLSNKNVFELLPVSVKKNS